MSKVKVRIAVIVDKDGCWDCCGYNGLADNKKMEFAASKGVNADAKYWIEAELDIPEVPVIQAQVSSGE